MELIFFSKSLTDRHTHSEIYEGWMLNVAKKEEDN